MCTATSLSTDEYICLYQHAVNLLELSFLRRHTHAFFIDLFTFKILSFRDNSEISIARLYNHLKITEIISFFVSDRKWILLLFTLLHKILQLLYKIFYKHCEKHSHWFIIKRKMKACITSYYLFIMQYEINIKTNIYSFFILFVNY